MLPGSTAIVDSAGGWSLLLFLLGRRILIKQVVHEVICGVRPVSVGGPRFLAG